MQAYKVSCSADRPQSLFELFHIRINLNCFIFLIHAHGICIQDEPSMAPLK